MFRTVLRRRSGGRRSRPPAAPELRTIQHGARLRVTHHPDSEGSLSTEDQKCLAHFLKFMETRGDAMIRKWRNGEQLAPEEEQYFTILKAMYLWRGWRLNQKGMWQLDPKGEKKELSPDQQDCFRYHAQVVQRGTEALKKGYRGGKLTAQDIEDLRDLRLEAAGRLFVGAAIIYPYALGLSPSVDPQNMRSTTRIYPS